MKEQKSIPATKVQRAAKFAATGARMGGNYLKYYAKKLVNPDTDRSTLDEANATDVYNALSELKGSALKVAQMISMDENTLPKAYIDKFQLAQYSAPPLSYPLVVSTFKKSFSQGPEQIFDIFSKKAVNAASIGQVHQATLSGKKYAVKVQYPGVAASVSSDLKLAKPIAMRLMNIKGRELDRYIKEVEARLLEETDYKLELKRSVMLGNACAHIPGLIFPTYYPAYSADRIITMDWIDGLHIAEWLATNPEKELRNRVGQALWDFYDYQIHGLKSVHADPHPGNFIITPAGQVGVIDFGCVKEIPGSFYDSYFRLLEPGLTTDTARFNQLLNDLQFILPTDSTAERTYFAEVFRRMVELLGRPFGVAEFDFGDKEYFDTIYALGEAISGDKQFRRSNAARGSEHGIYINRTYFGLYNLLHQLGATVRTGAPALEPQLQLAS